jgi:hypothetical protein
MQDGPWLFSRAVVDSEVAKAIVERARRGATYPAGNIPINKTCSLQQHREMGAMKRDCSQRARLR